jgi:hypothetical protein
MLWSSEAASAFPDSVLRLNNLRETCGVVLKGLTPRSVD